MIDAKTMLTNGVFCPIPWTGMMYNFDGKVKNCIRSAGAIGDLKTQPIDDILTGQPNLQTQQRMLNGQPGADCHTCYDLERGKKRFDIISDRIFYLRELKHVPRDTYESGNHDLRTVDIRWSNLCNFSCVYCGPEFSSRWAQELGVSIDTPTDVQKQHFKKYVMDRAANLDHVYMAGGEPLLLKENLDLLDVLARENPKVNIRINTNLSKVDTQVFDRICEFDNVHWTVSVETIKEQFDYVRWGGSWNDFLNNLTYIRSKPHKITFNMLYFLLNWRSFFDCVDFFCDMGFHPNSFVAGPLLTPHSLNVRHLHDPVLQSVGDMLRTRIESGPGYLLQDSYSNILDYIQQPFEKNMPDAMHQLQQMDQRRGIDSTGIFKDLYSIYKDYHGKTF